ncbi:MAG: sugar ABC transporter ATP-binding protein [Sedimentisphaerales bacterium]|jgi:ribose transport system ATP-binding protein|nr:sugar ABC transporter ATP-binding protein [Sedimentisphaerales bacterium]HNY78694.1 sugar ABC transporter ATP-binding protein [Sedimentisphaerales bacterium]HOC63889.1 sugar ABC transporter ATP-binding protein [Sedimentisphaerales bacterium]HOH64693.1 sugar ABC transporter ATP-binding protein [Sedimentisphaerales bacterium]HPY49153.1 sugar ABC transporter ATP-binding protein [Sedimentisphaerales bacterium]
MMPSATDVLLTVTGIDKAFPGVQALSQVAIDLRAGEVHALVGENGAGKSTLTRIIAGIETADAGQMLLDGQPYNPGGRRQAEAAGVRMVMQELNLIPNLSVAENIFIERLPNRFGFIDYRTLNRSAREAMQQVGLSQIDPSTAVGTLGVGQQQMVEIAAGLSRRCRVLALDEPTASLTDSEVELLFTQIAGLKANGVGIIYISHRIEEVLRIADRVTVLRDGKVVTTRDAAGWDSDDVIRLMVGRDLDRDALAPGGRRGALALRAVRLRAGAKVRDVSFEAYRGEILGVAGLMGSGRTETMRLVFGADPLEAGSIYLHGSDKPSTIRRPSDAVQLGIALLTEDRKEQGLFLPLAIRANVSIAHLDDVSTLGWLSEAHEKAVAQRYVDSLDVRCSSCEQAVGQLSGGNQQKVVIAKWLYRDCDILIFDEPTRGIDVGAKFEIYRMLASLAQQGKTIVFVSSDLKELMAISHRILVLSAGRVAGTFARDGWSEEQIMSAAFSEYV